ncbi:MAG: YggS family pyridoxal phosphate-dependent enzyme [Oscillospiraceae bacterium]|nr:YggS family pyridoxal phosphate-dependent enzyme [Oscillospiraceae bacterium]
MKNQQQRTQLPTNQVLRNLDEILNNVAKATSQIGKKSSDIKIVAVTKTVSAENVNIVLQNGIDIIGENRVQEFLSKQEEYNLDGKQFHFIGNLQTNKVKYIIDRVDMIQSLSSCHLADEINRQSAKINKVTDCLVEVNIGNEDTKGGIKKSELLDFLLYCGKLPNIRIKGLMAIPPKSEIYTKKSHYFQDMYKLFIDNNAKKIDNIFMDYLSMGMSSDYIEAILNGANVIRVGRALFGER